VANTEHMVWQGEEHKEDVDELDASADKVRFVAFSEM
jgi:hypothetical protein